MTLTLWLVPTASFAATPSSLMSQAMLSMMDAMGELAHRFKSNSNWSSGGGSLPYSSLYGLGGYPMNLYTMPGYGLPGVNPLQSPFQTPFQSPFQSPLPGLGGFPGTGGYPLASPLNQPLPSVSPVDGIWVGRGGEIVLVMYGYFRIYASAEVYRDGRFEIVGDRLVMFDPESDRRMVFEYALEDERMLMRSESGALLMFKKLPIPIPPYSLFANPASAYQ